MIRKPELLAAAGSVAEANVYFEAGADALVVGEDRFGMRLPGSMNPDHIREVTELAHASGRKIYVCMNNLMTNDLLADLPDYVKTLGAIGVDGVEFNDPSVLTSVKTIAPQIKLHWNAEMTATNYSTANYWGSKGASRVILARELNMDEITEMKPQLQVEAQVQIHGMTNIYHSKRRLVQSYMAHQGRPVGDEENLGKERGLFLIEAERQEEKYPIYEDVNGTHIMSSEDICILEDLHLLMSAGIDSFKVETLLKPLSYNEKVLRIYRNAIDLYAADPNAYAFQEAWMDEIRAIQDPERELSFGFFYKEQVY
ncbi:MULTISPECIES: peptidase U32 family protein [Paenibacillus]|uniref:Collagenase-like protease n=1 Tax=Paenibacillus campinasensis TaxID=66347 RepID=A0A268F5A7_9BACL|nr:MULTISPECIES: peptidase U32 family protein [Paenibacillus]MUG64439.1 U32 family peptidase [Paenibacillus campinasensis]PAD80563.1 collagenase-like protease [Paenibacillus campinasensis]PAK55161.1 collagenase-like protease [Paenibacillus sp. 7541]